MRFPVVLFDFDGTVVDSGPIILASMRHATQTVLAREYSVQELMANVGGPGLEAQMEAFAPDHVDELVRVYRAFARLPIAHYFDTVVGGDETKRHKPDPEPLLLGLARLDASADQAAYVGDSPYDMQAAKAAGLHAVGVTWG